MGSVIQMAGVSTGGLESALAQIDVPLNGAILGVEWACFADLETALDDQIWQLSFGSTFNSGNDSRQVISNATLGGVVHLTAVGAVMGQVNSYTKLPDIPVGMGERLFLHSSAAAGVVGSARCMVHFDFDVDQPKARRR